MQNGKPVVQEEALDALSHIAACVKEHFRTYYDTVMPHLKAVLTKVDLKTDLTLRARALECISFVGFAGGKEKFKEDAEQFLKVMKVLILLQGLKAKGDDPPNNYLLRACARICEFLGQDFLPYMGAVMPFLIKCVRLEPAMTNFAEPQIATACLMLRNYARILKEDFHPWIPQAVSVFAPFMKLYTLYEARKQAAKAMPLLLHSAKLAAAKGIMQGGSELYFTKLSGDIILSIVEALHEEPVIEVCAVMLDVLNDCLQICGPLLNEGQVHSIVDEIKHVITEISSRKQELKEREKSEDFDAEEAELLREEREQDDEVFKNVGKILCALIKAFKADFLSLLDELSSYLLPMWIALHGLGLWAIYDHSSFKPFVGEALSKINVVTTHLNALEPENVKAYDNAVSALGKLCQFYDASIDLAQVIPAWLSCLPIKADLYEAELVHQQLCSMLERSDREFLGPNYQYLPKVVSIFAEVLCAGEDLATEETVKHMIDLLRHFQQIIPPASWASAWSLLLPQQEMELESVLSPEEDVNL